MKMGPWGIVLCALLSGCMTSSVNNATMKTAGGPLIQAHRGSRGEFQDNGTGGFAWCLKKGIRGFETDVRFTKDRQLVIMHDGNAARTTDGTGVIEELTLAELKKFHLTHCSESVPTFEDVVAPLAGRNDVFIEIEMKAYPSAFYTPEVLTDFCRKLNASARKLLKPGTYAFTCFNLGTLKTMRAVDPAAPLGYIMGGNLTAKHIADAKALGCVSVAPQMKTTKEMIDQAHAAGLTVCLWMVQNATTWQEAKDKGCDRATSDYPHLLMCAVTNQRKKVVVLDLPAPQQTPPTEEKAKAAFEKMKAANAAALAALQKRYTCLTSVPGSPKACSAGRVSSWAKLNGFTMDDIVFVAEGTSFADGKRNSTIRTCNIDRIIVTDEKSFASAVSVLLK